MGQYHAEEWRHGWELVQNKYLELAGSPERVDTRSYERQGLDVLPTVHMGAAVSALERKGIETNIGNLNRDIKAANRMMNAIRSTIRNLRNWIAEIMEATKEAFAETEAQAKNTSPDLLLLLRDYLNLRKAERSDWSRYGQQKGTTDALKAVSRAIIYLKEHEIFTLEDLDAALQGMSEKSKGINVAMKKASARMKGITSEAQTEPIDSADITGDDLSELLSALFGSMLGGTEKSGKTGTVTTNGGKLNVRTGAGLDNYAFTQLPNGTVVEVAGTDGDWYMVRLPEKIGCVYSGYMTLSDTGGENDSNFPSPLTPINWAS